MVKTEFERELEQKPQRELINMCDQRDLDHAGDREALIARLVAYEEAKGTEPESAPEHGTEETEHGTEPKPEHGVEEPEPEPGDEPEPELKPEPEPQPED